jgi:hypothetical protein
MIEISAHESCCRMTKVAIQGGRHMILRFTSGCYTVAGFAIIRDPSMVESCAGEPTGSVAYAAILVGFNMHATLALGKHTVVARLTVVNNPNMIKFRGQESGRHVALTAICISRYVIAWFASSNATVVA